MSKYNVGDAFAIEIKEIHKDELYKDANGNYYTEQCLDGFERIKEIHDLEELEEMKKEAFDAGIEEVWKLIKTITFLEDEGGMSDKDIDEVFGTAYYSDIFSLSFQEVKEKVEAWKRKQAIEEGDVVEIFGAAAVVLAIDNGIATVYVLDDEAAKVQEVPLHRLKKTEYFVDVRNSLQTSYEIAKSFKATKIVMTEFAKEAEVASKKFREIHNAALKELAKGSAD